MYRFRRKGFFIPQDSVYVPKKVAMGNRGIKFQTARDIQLDLKVEIERICEYFKEERRYFTK